MELPHDMRGITGSLSYLQWKGTVERGLAKLDARIVALGASGAGARAGRGIAPGGTAGEVVIWLGTGVPAGALPVTGQTLERDEYAELYAAIGDSYATGAETQTQFSLPDLGSPLAGIYVVRV